MKAKLLSKTMFMSLICYAGIVSANSILVSGVYIKKPVAGVNVGAGYFTIENQEDKQIVLSGVTVKEFKKAEMHETLIENGSSRMKMVSEVTIPPKSSVSFLPGGKHLMLFDPVQSVQKISQIELTFQFRDGRKVTAEASVR